MHENLCYSILINLGLKETVILFDVTMGGYGGAEICELVGIFTLSLLSRKFSSNNIGLYLDDGLSVFRNISGRQAEKYKKQFKIFLKTKAYK